MKLNVWREQWEKVRQRLAETLNMPADQIPTADALLNLANQENYRKSFEEILGLTSLKEKVQDVKTCMRETGLISKDPQNAWTIFENDWKKSALHMKFNLDMEEPRKWAEENITDFSDRAIKGQIEGHESRFYTYAIQEVNARHEYYKNYEKLTKKQKQLVDSDDIPALVEAYHNKKTDPELKEYLNHRIEKLVHTKKAIQDASAAYLKAIREGEKVPSPFGRVTKDENRIKFDEMDRRDTTQMQTTRNGCWSVALSTLLKHQGIDITQNDLRQLKTKGRESFSNLDIGQTITDYAPFVHETIPNSMVCTVSFGMAMPKTPDEKKESNKKMIDLVSQCIEKANSPVALLVNNHYRIVYGIGTGNDTSKIYIHDPNVRSSANTDIETFLQKCQSESNGACSFQVDWIQNVEVDENGTPQNLDQELKKAMDADSTNKQISVVSGTDENPIFTQYLLPDRFYSPKEVEEIWNARAQEKENNRLLKEKIERWDADIRSTVDDCKGRNDGIWGSVDWKTRIELEKNFLEEIKERRKNEPLFTNEELEHAKILVSPRKLEQLRLEQSNPGVSAKKYMTSLEAREDVIAAYDTIKNGREYGKGDHVAFREMKSALEEYKNMYSKLYAKPGEVPRKEDFLEVLKATKKVHDACETYLKSHLEKGKHGKHKLGGQFFETGRIRKQAAAQILEKIENLPEYKEILEKEKQGSKADGELLNDNQAENANRKPEAQGQKEKITFVELRDEVKDSLKKHSKVKSAVPGKELAYGELEKAKERAKAAQLLR